MAEEGAEYETKTVTVVRGLEARYIKKWEEDGWELVSRSEMPMLRTQLGFRRVKPKTPWLLLSGIAAVTVAGIAILGIMSLGAGRDEQAAAPVPATTVATSSQQVPEKPAETYTYEGPDYEIVVVDGDVGPAALDQYWIYTAAIDGSTAGYKDQTKAIIQDIAHEVGTDKFIAHVVTDKEIALAEAISTYENFIDEYGDDYAINDIPKKEVTGWVAAYTGGFDYDTREASDADSAYETLWWPNGDMEIEEWRPASEG